MSGRLDGKVAIVTGGSQGIGRAVADGLGRHGRVDILVNNAGLYASLPMRPFTEIPPEEWRQVMDVNVASMFLTCRAVAPVMREQGGGKIVNISSGTPFLGVPFLLLADPEVVEKLRDASVAARTIQRDQVAEDVVGAVVFFAGPGADFVTGQTMVIDGGQYFH